MCCFKLCTATLPAHPRVCALGLPHWGDLSEGEPLHYLLDDDRELWSTETVF